MLFYAPHWLSHPQRKPASFQWLWPWYGTRLRCTRDLIPGCWGANPKLGARLLVPHLAHLASCPIENRGFTSVPRNWFQRVPIFETNGVKRKMKRCLQLPVLTDLVEVSLAHCSSIKWQSISCLQIETYLVNWGVEGQEGERYLEVTYLVNIFKGPLRVERKYKMMFPILVGF